MNRHRGRRVSESGMAWRVGTVAILGVAAMGLAGAGWPAQPMHAQAVPTQAAQPAPMPEHLPGIGMPAMQRMMPHPGDLVVGYEGKEAVWSAERLKTLPATTVTVWNAHAKANQRYTGVAAGELLGMLGFPLQPHGRELRLYAVATGADGYEVVFSGGELMPELGTGTVLVAYARDGAALGKDGPLQVVVTGDKRPARWVRNLVSLRVGQTP